MSTAPATPTGSHPAHSPAVRSAGPDVLSLALMNARNGLLGIWSQLDAALEAGAASPGMDAATLARMTGSVAWMAEYWIGRNPRRSEGVACPANALHLASIDPQADTLFDPRQPAPAAGSGSRPPNGAALRAYLLETLESTLDLLERSAPTDDALYFFRAALFHEDWRSEQLIQLAQGHGVRMALALPAGYPSREAILVPGGRWTLGWTEGGFSQDIETPAHEVAVPDFEIDAQAVNWSQFVEFVDDGGYDRPDLWRPEGWQWLEGLAQGEGRRGPRHVEQIGVASGAVMQTLFGRPTRMSGAQSAMHVSWWEADAFARWSGRRLPTEVEWEMAAHCAARRGWRWGDVLEWTAGTLRPWPGFQHAPWTRGTDLDALPAFGQARVQRGASFATPARLRHLRTRRFSLPGRDDAFVGFRTCAV